jgi:hypothetical protein
MPPPPYQVTPGPPYQVPARPKNLLLTSSRAYINTTNNYTANTPSPLMMIKRETMMKMTTDETWKRTKRMKPRTHPPLNQTGPMSAYI